MRTIKKDIILLLLLAVFISIFKYNYDIRKSILDSTNLWFNTLVPSMLSMYLITDLLINYGISNYLYKLFKSNRPFLLFISLLLGCPANSKYIKDFLSNNYIDNEDARWLLMNAYSPNPLFLITISPNNKVFLITISTLYISNILLGFLTKNMLNKNINSIKLIKQEQVTKVLENSIYKSWNILLLILGIIIVYGIINTLIYIYFPKIHIIIPTLLELTNALNIINKTKKYKYFILAVSFGGLSIHTQIKSILDNDALYNSFLFGRIFSLIIAILFIFLF